MAGETVACAFHHILRAPMVAAPMGVAGDLATTLPAPLERDPEVPTGLWLWIGQGLAFPVAALSLSDPCALQGTGSSGCGC